MPGQRNRARRTLEHKASQRQYDELPEIQRIRRLLGGVTTKAEAARRLGIPCYILSSWMRFSTFPGAGPGRGSGQREGYFPLTKIRQWQIANAKFYRGSNGRGDGLTARQRYERSEKGKAARARYEKTPKGKAAQRKYQRRAYHESPEYRAKKIANGHRSAAVRHATFDARDELARLLVVNEILGAAASLKG